MFPNARICRSGTDEEYTEREQLLTEYDGVLEERKREEVTKKEKEKEKDEQGVEIRREAMEAMNEMNGGSSGTSTHLSAKHFSTK